MLRLHIGEPATENASESWFGPILFTGDFAWEGFTRGIEDTTEVVSTNEVSLYNGVVGLHERILKLNTNGEMLFYDSGTPMGLPATQTVRTRMHFIPCDLDCNFVDAIIPSLSSDIGTGLHMVAFEEGDAPELRLYTRVDGNPRWVTVFADGFAPETSDWLDVELTFDNTGEETRVSCRVDGKLFADDAGNTSFPLANGNGRKVVNGVSFAGTGYIDVLSGTVEGIAPPTQAEMANRIAEALAAADQPIIAGEGCFAVAFAAPFAGTYALVAAATPGGDFLDIGVSATVAAGEAVRLEDRSATDGARFYRIRFLPGD